MAVIEAKGVNGQVRFDGESLVITREGAMARATVGAGEKRIPISSVTAVQWKPPSRLVRGFIQFTVSGGSELRSKPGKQTKDAARDENSVIVGYSHKEQFDALRSAVNEALDAR